LSADLPSSLLEEPNRTRLHVYKHFQLNPNLFNLLQFLNVTTFFYFLLSLFSFKTKIEREVGFCFFEQTIVKKITTIITPSLLRKCSTITSSSRHKNVTPIHLFKNKFLVRVVR
jgi:hypothetical protein